MSRKLILQQFKSDAVDTYEASEAFDDTGYFFISV